MSGDATINAVGAARQPDQFGVVWPDGAWFTVTEAAHLFGQDAEERARLTASKIGGRAVRVVTFLLDIDSAAGGSVPADPPTDERPCHMGNGFTVKCGLLQAGPITVAGQWELVTCADCLALRPADPKEQP